MSNNGWICLHRSLLGWEWYNDINVTRLFIHCLIKANHKPKKWRGVAIDRGQFWTSLDSLSKETGLSTSKLRTAILKLEKTGELASKGQAGGRMVTVLRYGEYQENDKPVSKELASGSQASSKPLAATNNDNNHNNETSNTSDKPKPDDADIKFASWMLSLITNTQPDFKKPNLGSWANTIRLMRDRDHRNHHDMGVVWKWARNDSFWQSNILSADKFRKQYDTLKAQMDRPVGGRYTTAAQETAQRMADGFKEGSKEF